MRSIGYGAERAGEGALRGPYSYKMPLTPTLSPLRGERERTEFAAPNDSSLAESVLS
jgi:hypothetical protein